MARHRIRHKQGKAEQRNGVLLTKNYVVNEKIGKARETWRRKAVGAKSGNAGSASPVADLKGKTSESW